MYCYSHDLGGIRHVLLPVILWQALQSAESFRASHLVSIKSFDNGKVAQRLEPGFTGSWKVQCGLVCLQNLLYCCWRKSCTILSPKSPRNCSSLRPCKISSSHSSTQNMAIGLLGLTIILHCHACAFNPKPGLGDLDNSLYAAVSFGILLDYSITLGDYRWEFLNMSLPQSPSVISPSRTLAAFLYGTPKMIINIKTQTYRIRV